MIKLNARQLRKTKPEKSYLTEIKKNPIYFVLDRIIDTYNIGSLFRLADAVAIEKMYLCGKMDYPPSSRIHKAAVGTEEWVSWEKTNSTTETLKRLRAMGVQILVVEQNREAISYKDLNSVVRVPLAIVVGNETNGISKEVLDLADIIVELPMFGVNKSFNVWGSAAVITYKVIEGLS